MIRFAASQGEVTLRGEQSGLVKFNLTLMDGVFPEDEVEGISEYPKDNPEGS